MAFRIERGEMVQGREAGVVDAGLRQHMLRIYNYMASGLALTGILAYAVANTPALQALFFQFTARGVGLTMLGWVAFIAPFALVMVLSFGINRMKPGTAQALFWVYAALMGISLSSIFLVYTGTSITRTFFVTAASFAGLSLWGYTTKRDLSAFGSFLVIGLFGIVIASLVNMFLASTMMNFIISVLGVLIFAGLTAYDTQKLKEMYWEADAADVAGRKAVMGALTLYLDFINLFLFLLRFMGDRRQ